MKVLTIIIMAVALCFGVTTTQKSPNECFYQLHKISNELNGILYFGLREQMDFAGSSAALNEIELYPEEVKEFENFMNKLKAGYDKSDSPTYFLDKARKKIDEFNRKAEECERIAK